MTKSLTLNHCPSTLNLLPKIPWGGAVVARGAWHGLQFAKGDVFPDLAIRGAHGIVADAGKLACADVVVRLEVFVQGIGELGCGEGLAHLALYAELDIGKAIEQVLVGAETDSADAHVLARRCCGAGVAAELHGECAQAVELYAVPMAEGFGNLLAQGIPHELHIGVSGCGGVVDVDGHPLDVYFLWVGYGDGDALGVGILAAKELAAVKLAGDHGSVGSACVHVL